MNGFCRTARTLLIALATVAAFSAPAAAKAVLNPQAGMTWTNYSFDDNEAINEDAARVGYALGGTVRFGSALYLAPGLYYQQTGFEATATDNLTLDTITESVGVNALLVWPSKSSAMVASAIPVPSTGVGVAGFICMSMVIELPVGFRNLGSP